MTPKNSIKKIGIIPPICEKCGIGKMEKKSGGRVYVCNNPKCQMGVWINFAEK